ncbi:hypothetical protein [Shimia ponticola]|uniref:hypothetical protein n=1 Tax=Shimia ponticola TaxID=2582893 RepID=UPI0011BDB9FE|nr:hypothetical protein [Shimia ponticola]
MTSVSPDFDAFENDLVALGVFGTEPKKSDRQILFIDSVIHHSSGFVERTGAKPGSGNYLRISGRPSPSSDVESAVVYFVPPDQIRAPRYQPTLKRIDLWLNADTMAMTLAQLTHSQRYLFVGTWPNGHVYGDIHTVP